VCNRRIGRDKSSRVAQIEQSVNGMQRAKYTEHCSTEDEQDGTHSNSWHAPILCWERLSRRTHDFRSNRPLRKGTLGVHKETIALSVFAKARLALQKPKALWLGARKSLTRAEAIEQYVILRLRTEDINRLDFLVNTLYDKRITLLPDSPFSAQDLKDTVRTGYA
jgi:hypothetical protein